MPAHPTTLYALDFDGVIADGLDECLLTAWLTWHELPVARFDEATLRTIPDTFRDRFAHLRNFVRHDGHFLVAFACDDDLATASAFEARYAALPLAERDAFRAAFIALRSTIRTEKPDVWLRMHTVYPDLLPALRAGAVDAIVSGKDGASIEAILHASAVPFPAERIFGRVSDKRPILDDLRAQAAARGAELVFCDDNVDNAVDIAALGITVLWARWGYGTPEQRNRAETIGLKGISAPELAALLDA